LRRLHERTTDHLRTRPESVSALGQNLEEAALTVLGNVLLNLDATLTKE